MNGSSGDGAPGDGAPEHATIQSWWLWLDEYVLEVTMILFCGVFLAIFEKRWSSTAAEKVFPTAKGIHRPDFAFADHAGRINFQSPR